MQSKNRLMLALLMMLSMMSANVYAFDEPEIDLSLYPPLASGEASPWQGTHQLPEPDTSVHGKPWAAAPGMPMAPVNPYYGDQAQPQTPYYYPPQQAYGYGYAPPPYGYVPSYPPQPYGNYGGSFNSSPFARMPFNGAMPFNNNPYSPFGFSMPWPF